MAAEQFSRTELLLGREKMEKLQRAKVAVFGIGGVGGYVVEALARTGIGSLVLVDHDRVSESNLNRQIIATHKTIGQYKVDVMADRIHDINPEAQVEVRRCFYLPENADSFDFSSYSYVVDAVDTVTAKLEIIERAKEAGCPVISSMGAGNKLDPGKFQLADIYKTSMCPLAKVMRRECRKRGITDLKVVYSTEEPLIPARRKNNHESGENGHTGESGNTGESRHAGTMNLADEKNCGYKKAAGRDKPVPGSIAFVPSVAGLILAAEVVRDLTATSHS